MLFFSRVNHSHLPCKKTEEVLLPLCYYLTRKHIFLSRTKRQKHLLVHTSWEVIYDKYYIYFSYFLIYSFSLLSKVFFSISTNSSSFPISLPSIFSTTRILSELTKIIGSVVSKAISFSSIGNCSKRICREIPFSPLLSIGGVTIFPLL